MNAIFIIIGLGVFIAGFVVGALFSMYLNGDLDEDFSKPNCDYD